MFSIAWSETEWIVLSKKHVLIYEALQMFPLIELLNWSIFLIWNKFLKILNRFVRFGLIWKTFQYQNQIFLESKNSKNCQKTLHNLSQNNKVN